MVQLGKLRQESRMVIRKGKWPGWPPAPGLWNKYVCVE